MTVVAAKSYHNDEELLGVNTGTHPTSNHSPPQSVVGAKVVYLWVCYTFFLIQSVDWFSLFTTEAYSSIRLKTIILKLGILNTSDVTMSRTTSTHYLPFEMQTSGLQEG